MSLLNLRSRISCQRNGYLSPINSKNYFTFVVWNELNSKNKLSAIELFSYYKTQFVIKERVKSASSVC